MNHERISNPAALTSTIVDFAIRAHPELYNVVTLDLDPVTDELRDKTIQAAEQLYGPLGKSYVGLLEYDNARTRERFATAVADAIDSGSRDDKINAIYLLLDVTTRISRE